MIKCESNIALEWGVGEKESNGHKVALRSKKGEDVGTFYIGYYYILDDKLMYSNFSKQKTIFDLKSDSLFLKIEKDNSDQLKFVFCSRDGNEISHDLQMNDVKTIKGIDFKQYLNANQPQIYIKTENGSKTAYLYDIQDNKIGNLVDGGAICVSLPENLEDLFYFSSAANDKYQLTGEELPNITISFVDSEAHLQETDYGSNITITNIDSLNIDYNTLDKIMENDLCYQHSRLTENCKNLCKEYNDFLSGLGLNTIDC